jgi:hypothetical protein
MHNLGNLPSRILVSYSVLQICADSGSGIENDMKTDADTDDASHYAADVVARMQCPTRLDSLQKQNTCLNNAPIIPVFTTHQHTFFPPHENVNMG